MPEQMTSTNWTKWKMGDHYKSGKDDYVLARTNNYLEQENPTKFHFQFIDIDTGNRLSNRVITHTIGVDNCSEIEEFEAIYLLEVENEVDAVLALRHNHKTGFDWK